MSNRSIVKLGAAVAVTFLATLLAQAAFAQNSVTPKSPTEARIAFVKIDVNDLEASAKAYAHALQMQDLGRIHSKTPLLDEATLKFGDSPDHARASDTPGIVLVFVPGRKPLQGAPGKTPSAVLTVPDVAATVARAKEAGFTVGETPKTADGYTVGTIVDPSGNVIELIHLP
jgi:hypothetical protein